MSVLTAVMSLLYLNIAEIGIFSYDICFTIYALIYVQLRPNTIILLGINYYLVTSRHIEGNRRMPGNDKL